MAAGAAGVAADELPPPRQACSSSANVGRTWPGMARRADSTAMIGAVPLRNEMIRTFKTFEIGALFVGGFGHVGRNRSDQAIAKQDAEKCADQSGLQLYVRFLPEVRPGLPS